MLHIHIYIYIYIYATIYGDRRYEGLGTQRKGPGVLPEVLRPHFGPWNASRASWDALCATGTQLGRPEGSRRALQRGRSGPEGASKRLRGRSERLLESALGQIFDEKSRLGDARRSDDSEVRFWDFFVWISDGTRKLRHAFCIVIYSIFSVSHLLARRFIAMAAALQKSLKNASKIS